MILKTKTTTTGGNLTDKGVTTVGREKGRLTACKKMSENQYSTDLDSHSSDLASGRVSFCVGLIRKLIIKAFCVPKAYTRGILPVSDNEPSYFMRLPAVCASLDLSTHDENSRAKLIEVIGSLYSWLRSGNTWWEFKKNSFIVKHGFQKSFVNPCAFHLYWEELY